MEAKIKVEHLNMKYKQQEVLAIDELSFDSGISYGIVGHNGAGKTTLFKCMTNIIPTYTGTITLEGQNIREHNEMLLKVGIVLDGMSVYKNRTGWFNIQYFSGLRGNVDEKKAEKLAQDLELEGVLDKKVSTYSYGMQKKLILLIALMHTPEILILDEPFRGLDIDSVSWFKKYLKSLIKNGLTLIISSHVQNDLETLCDEVYVIDQGKLINHINLNEEKQKMVRVISTSNNARLAELLDQANYYYSETDEDDSLKIDISDERWTAIREALQEEKIEIYELSKVKVLEDKLN
ncbi:ATP-binding cassette domain-containing protein [Vagococcus entomophilus]|uniref:Multidrug ABC transporter ATP-binding protein n=1 Tax=Vagococcus entomophilus TaxID=1160095 RepID=A0A430AET2_9ENTE|nr:ABC transporter ATP-binding protein [Vagococcus entomophilus]RSU05944.1 multidrug ABC transporter ATP-binding protein [Vagococcus entomophilus]